jgi:hypothetical protein
MASIDDFLAVTVVAAGSGSGDDTAQAVTALNRFLEGSSDQKSALALARRALDNLALSGRVTEDLGAYIDARIAGRGHPVQARASSSG